MKILVLNCGSSSIKYKLFDMDSNKVIAKGGVEKLGMPGAFLELKLPNGEKVLIEKEMQEHTAGVEFILENLLHPVHGAIKSLDEIDAVGHRIVHGGEHFNQSVLLDEKMLEVIESCSSVSLKTVNLCVCRRLKLFKFIKGFFLGFFHHLFNT